MNKVKEIYTCMYMSVCVCRRRIRSSGKHENKNSSTAGAGSSSRSSSRHSRSSSSSSSKAATRQRSQRGPRQTSRNLAAFTDLQHPLMVDFLYPCRKAFPPCCWFNLASSAELLLHRFPQGTRGDRTNTWGSTATPNLM